ncbi:hypothetical protein ACFYZ0_18150 [Streptomyces sp. NPDC001708]|uniref:hypothetical protein n=1 Tax=Streptomyces sp. NPDC001708 TaxID=3364602 RepID=UPI003690CC29
MPSELIDYQGAAEGCPICLDDVADVPFISDEAAVAHYATHSPHELAFALLRYKALVQHALVVVDEPGGIRTEQDLEEIITEVEYTAQGSPARPTPSG